MFNRTYPTGYRSPLRPIPIDALPSPWVSTDSEQILNDTEFNDDRINYQSLSNDQNCLLLFSDKKNITDSSVKDSWWLEAIRVADDVENKRNMVEPHEHDLIHLHVHFFLLSILILHDLSICVRSNISHKSYHLREILSFLLLNFDPNRILAVFYARAKLIFRFEDPILS